MYAHTLFDCIKHKTLAIEEAIFHLLEGILFFFQERLHQLFEALAKERFLEIDKQMNAYLKKKGGAHE